MGLQNCWFHIQEEEESWKRRTIESLDMQLEDFCLLAFAVKRNICSLESTYLLCYRREEWGSERTRWQSRWYEGLRGFHFKRAKKSIPIALLKPFTHSLPCGCLKKVPCSLVIRAFSKNKSMSFNLYCLLLLKKNHSTAKLLFLSGTERNMQV